MFSRFVPPLPVFSLSQHSCILHSVDNRKWNTVSWVCRGGHNLSIVNKITYLIYGGNISHYIVLHNKESHRRHFLYWLLSIYCTKTSESITARENLPIEMFYLLGLKSDPCLAGSKSQGTHFWIDMHRIVHAASVINSSSSGNNLVNFVRALNTFKVFPFLKWALKRIIEKCKTCQSPR